MAEEEVQARDGQALGPEGGPQERRSKVATWALGLLLSLALLWLLYRTMWVTMPVVAAFFIAVGVWPVVSEIQKRVPARFDWLGYLAAMALILLLLALFFLGIWYAATTVAGQWPQYEDELQKSWQQLSRWLGEGTGDEAGQNVLSEIEPQSALAFVSDYALTVVRSIWEVVALLVLIFFLVLLMLIEGRSWHEKLIEATSPEKTAEWLQVVEGVGRRFRRYLAVRGLVGLLSGGLYAGWLWIWGIDFIVVWFLLAALLSFLPTIGSVIAGGLAAAFAFLQLDPGTAAIVAIGVLAIEQVTGNYVDPRLQGRQLSVSPLISLFMLLVWGWIWGVAGALLALPITVLLMIVFARFPPLVPLALLLSGETSRKDLFEAVEAD